MLNHELSPVGHPPTAIKAVQASGGGGSIFPADKSLTYFNEDAITLNFKDYQCFTVRPCKRPCCHYCTNIRRSFYVPAVAHFADLHDACFWVTLSWLAKVDVDPWPLLAVDSGELFQKMNQARHFLEWVRALGKEKGTPHIHLFTSYSGLKFLRDYRRERWPKPQSLVYAVKVPTFYDLQNVAGYMFDSNLMPSLRDSRRPKRARVVGGTQGIPRGFPNSDAWRLLNNLRAIHHAQKIRAAIVPQNLTINSLSEISKATAPEKFQHHVSKMMELGYISFGSLKTEQSDV